LIRKTSQQLEPSYPEWLESQRAWRGALRSSLDKRSADPSAAAAELNVMLTEPDRYWTEKYREKSAANRAHTLSLLLALNASLSTEQRAEFQRRLTKFAEELESLAHNPKRAT
jgi:hypothetical protein